MPYVIVKRSAIFVEDTYEQNPVTKETVQIITNQITVYPNADNVPQEIPDWAETDELYDIGVQEGWIIVVGEQSARAQIDRANKKADAQNKEKVPTGLQQPTTQQQTPSAWKK